MGEPSSIRGSKGARGSTSLRSCSPRGENWRSPVMETFLGSSVMWLLSVSPGVRTYYDQEASSCTFLARFRNVSGEKANHGSTSLCS